MDEDEFVHQPSTSSAINATTSALPTLHTIIHLPQSTRTSLFAPYTIFLAPGSPRPLLEFTIRAFGGRVGWPASMGAGSPILEDDESITHVVIDRPLPPANASDELRRRRKYIQPQWIVDSINAQKALLEAPYAQGEALPPHLSPFGEESGAYMPEAVGADGEDEGVDVAVSSDEEAEEEEVEEDEEMEMDAVPTVALDAAALAPSDPALLRAAEIEAERAGLDTAEFEATLKKAVKKAGGKKAGVAAGKEKEKEVASEVSKEAEMNKMMMSNKQRKLYEKMKFGERKKAVERETLEDRRVSLRKEKAKELRKAAKGGVSTK